MNPFLHTGFNTCTDPALVLKELVNTLKQHEFLELKCPSSRTKSLDSGQRSSTPGKSSREQPRAGSWVVVPLGGPGRPLQPFWQEREVMDSLETSRKIMQGLLVTELSESFFRLNCEDGERQMGVRVRWGWDGRWWEPRWGSVPSTQMTGEKRRPWSPQVPWRPMQSTVLLQRGERVPSKKGEHLRGYSVLESRGGDGPPCRSVPGPQGRAVGRSRIPFWLMSPRGRWLGGSGEQLTNVLSSNSPASL